MADDGTAEFFKKIGLFHEPKHSGTKQKNEIGDYFVSKKHDVLIDTSGNKLPVFENDPFVRVHSNVLKHIPSKKVVRHDENKESLRRVNKTKHNENLNSEHNWTKMNFIDKIIKHKNKSYRVTGPSFAWCGEMLNRSEFNERKAEAESVISRKHWHKNRRVVETDSDDESEDEETKTKQKNNNYEDTYEDHFRKWTQCVRYWLKNSDGESKLFSRKQIVNDIKKNEKKHNQPMNRRHDENHIAMVKIMKGGRDYRFQEEEQKNENEKIRHRETPFDCKMENENKLMMVMRKTNPKKGDFSKTKTLFYACVRNPNEPFAWRRVFISKSGQMFLKEKVYEKIDEKVGEDEIYDDLFDLKKKEHLSFLRLHIDKERDLNEKKITEAIKQDLDNEYTNYKLDQTDDKAKGFFDDLSIDHVREKVKKHRRRLSKSNLRNLLGLAQNLATPDEMQNKMKDVTKKETMKKNAIDLIIKKLMEDKSSFLYTTRETEPESINGKQINLDLIDEKKAISSIVDKYKTSATETKRDCQNAFTWIKQMQEHFKSLTEKEKDVYVAIFKKSHDLIKKTCDTMSPDEQERRSIEEQNNYLFLKETPQHHIETKPVRFCDQLQLNYKKFSEGIFDFDKLNESCEKLYLTHKPGEVGHENEDEHGVVWRITSVDQKNNNWVELEGYKKEKRDEFYFTQKKRMKDMCGEMRRSKNQNLINFYNATCAKRRHEIDLEEIKKHCKEKWDEGTKTTTHDDDHLSTFHNCVKNKLKMHRERDFVDKDYNYDFSGYEDYEVAQFLKDEMMNSLVVPPRK